VEPPTISDTQSLEQLQPIQDESGNWKMSWAVHDLTPEEIQIKKEYEEYLKIKYETELAQMLAGSGSINNT
jgi:hypothetical protein